MGMKNLRPLPVRYVPTALDPEFDEQLIGEEALRMVGYSRGRSVGSDDQCMSGELPDVLFDGGDEEDGS